MKNIRNALLAILMAMSLSSCASVLVAITAPIRNMQISVENTLPGPFGYIGAAATVVGIKNPTVFYAKIFANDQEDSVCVIPPGGAVYDDWLMDFPSAQLSLVAGLYYDSLCTQWAGMDMDILDIYKHQVSVWPIGQFQIFYPDDAYRYQSYYGVSAYPLTMVGGTRKVSIPMPPLKGTNNLAIADCTHYIMLVRAQTLTIARVKPGQSWRWARNQMYYPATLDLELVFVDQHGFNYGYKDLGPVTLMTNGPAAWQYMATVHDIQKPRY